MLKGFYENLKVSKKRQAIVEHPYAQIKGQQRFGSHYN
jgi:hypothetical protein